MRPDDIHKAKDQDIPASLAAMKRAAALARELAIQTNTAIIVLKDEQIVRLTAKELRQEKRE